MRGSRPIRVAVPGADQDGTRHGAARSRCVGRDQSCRDLYAVSRQRPDHGAPMRPVLIKSAAVLAAVKVRPGSGESGSRSARRPTFTASARSGTEDPRSGRRKPAARSNEGMHPRKTKNARVPDDDERAKETGFPRQIARRRKLVALKHARPVFLGHTFDPMSLVFRRCRFLSYFSRRILIYKSNALIRS
jgi:hypothetical protein